MEADEEGLGFRKLNFHDVKKIDKTRILRKPVNFENNTGISIETCGMSENVDTTPESSKVDSSQCLMVAGQNMFFRFVS